MNMKYFFLAMSAACALAAAAEPASFHIGPAQVALLELYTSEGCSSCPPADAWLNRLTNSPGLWKDFVPVAFHVDYWNNLGWRDAAAAPEFSQRQRDYAAQWRAENIYTPEFVLNGAEWRYGFGLRGAPGLGKAAGALGISSTNNFLWNVMFTPLAETNGTFEIHAALLAGGIVSEVKGGENRGRTLPHEFTVVELVQVGLKTGDGVARGKFILPAVRRTAEKKLAVAAWITRAGELTPLQATGGWLVVKEK